MSEFTIHVGDCMEALRAMPSNSVDAIVTDPPYGMQFQSAWATGGPRFKEIIGDDRPAVEWLPEGVRALRDGCAMFIFCEWRFQEVFRQAIEEAGATVRSHCIWDREVHGMGDLKAAFAPCHDIGWFATKGSGFEFHGKRPQTVLRFPRVAASRLVHPAEKPVALLRTIIRTICPHGGTVLDPFAGSGTTGAAAIEEERRAILCEMDPGYAEIARNRCSSAATGGDWRHPAQGGQFGGVS